MESQIENKQEEELITNFVSQILQVYDNNGNDNNKK